MITLAEWKLIGIILIATFFISAIVLGIIIKIATRIKNKEDIMDETINRLKNVFGNEYTGIKTLESKLAFATGYMKDNDDLTRREALYIINKILIGEL